MSFPGGKYETTDETYQQGALRETEEEMGIPRETIELLGKLTPMYIPVSNFIVYPFVGVLSATPNVFGNVVWGATAMMLSEFVEVVKKVEEKIIVTKEM